MSNNKPRKLTRAQVDEIRTSTESLLTLARRYGVSKALIQQIRAGTIWKE